MQIYDAAPGRLLLGELPDPAPGATDPRTALVVDAAGRVLSGRNIASRCALRPARAWRRYPLPTGGGLAGVADGLAAILTPSSLRTMRLSDGRSITLLHSAHIAVAVSPAGIAYSYRLARGPRRVRVDFVPLRALHARLR